MCDRQLPTSLHHSEMHNPSGVDALSEPESPNLDVHIVCFITSEDVEEFPLHIDQLISMHGHPEPRNILVLAGDGRHYFRERSACFFKPRSIN